MESNCLFCKIVNKEMPARILFENEYTLAFLDVNPTANGHSLVVPKKHFANFSVTEQPYLDEVNHTKQLVAKMLLNSELEIKGINYVSNQEEIAGQSIPHYHEHIIPKYQVNEGFNLDQAINAVNLQDLDQVYQAIKK